MKDRSDEEKSRLGPYVFQVAFVPGVEIADGHELDIEEALRSVAPEGSQ